MFLTMPTPGSKITEAVRTDMSSAKAHLTCCVAAECAKAQMFAYAVDFCHFFFPPEKFLLVYKTQKNQKV
jgi:hypothetical protein